MEDLLKLWYNTGFHDLDWRMLLMWLVSFGLLYLAVKKNFEPLLLVPIAFGALIANLPTEGILNKAGGTVVSPGYGIITQLHIAEADEVEMPRVIHPSKSLPHPEVSQMAFRERRDILPELFVYRPFVRDPLTGQYVLKDGTQTSDLPDTGVEAQAYQLGEPLPIVSDASGRVTEIYVKEGSLVHKNEPVAELHDEHASGLFYYIKLGVLLEVFPPLIFLGVGALTDFGPLIANPRTLLLGAAAQFGVFATFLGASFIGFTPMEAGAIGIIGGADGPTSIFVSNKLAPHLMGAIAVAAYSYMALVPVIQPPIMRLLTTEKERKIKMKSLRKVGRLEKLTFALIVTMFCIIFVPAASALIGMLMLGNFLRECGVTERLSKASQNEVINIVTIFLGTSVGMTMTGEAFLNTQTLYILALGIVAFGIATGCGVLLARLMNLVSRTPINPLIGSAGVSAVPMAARVSQVEGQKADPSNFLLMHAMGPNVAGVIGTAVAAGVFISYFTN